MNSYVGFVCMRDAFNNLFFSYTRKGNKIVLPSKHLRDEKAQCIHIYMCVTTCITWCLCTHACVPYMEKEKVPCIKLIFRQSTAETDEKLRQPEKKRKSNVLSRFSNSYLTKKVRKMTSYILGWILLCRTVMANT